MAIPDILFLVFIILSVLYFIKIFMMEKRTGYRILSVVLCIVGLGLAYLDISQYFKLDPSVTKNISSSEKYLPAAPAVEFKNAHLQSADSVVFKANEPLPEDFLDKSNKIIYIDLSQGITSENIKTLDKYFSGIKIEKLNALEDKKVCWIRHPLFPYASGLCENRSVEYVMNGGIGDINRIEENQTVAKVSEIQGKTVFVVSYKLQDKNLSNEEVCLSSLKQGRPCAAVEILPSNATSALYVSSSDSTIQSVLEEFNISSSKVLLDSLDIYSKNTLLSVRSENISAESDILKCGGLVVSGSSAEIKMSELVGVKRNLAKADRESKLAREAKLLANYVNCPGIFHLDIPSFKKRDLKTSSRSFVSHLMKNSFWFADGKSYLNRYEQIKDVKLEVDDQASRVRIKSQQPIKNLAITFVMQKSFPEELLQGVEVKNIDSGWRLYRMGPSSFRISFDKLDSEAVVELDHFLASLEKPHLGFKLFFETPGIVLSLGVAFILATLFTFIHITSSTGPVIWALTFVPVFLIQFILIFLSFMTSRTMNFDGAMFAKMENPAFPYHFFLREWPDEWFEKKEQPVVVNIAGMQKSEKWKQALRLAESAVKNGPNYQDVQVLQQDLIYGSGSAGTKNVVVWDYAATRNFYYRKSSVYSSIILGWRELSTKDFSIAISSAADFSEISNIGNNTVLVIPDIRFLSSEDISRVSEFVRGGGTLVFSEKLSSEDDGTALKDKNALTQVLENVGLGQSKALNYSRLDFEALNVEGLNTLHRSADQQGTLIKGEALGQGVVLFMGVYPIDESSRRFVKEVIARVKGKTIQVPQVAGNCSTALLIQPWTASMGDLDKYSKKLKSSGYEVRWLVDSLSLANMATVWESRFKSEGVVFLDDGKDVSRIMAGSLLKSLGAAESPVFASFKTVSGESVSGPEGTLISIKNMNGKNPISESKLLASECMTGFSRPRLIVANSSSEWNAIVDALVANKPFQLTGLQDYIGRLRAVRSGNVEKQQILFKKTNPLEFDLEKK